MKPLDKIVVDPGFARSLVDDLRRLAGEIEIGQHDRLHAPSVLRFEQGLALCLLPSSRVIESERASALLSQISPRQRLVLARLLEGKSAKIIAFELGISRRTVEHHIASILRTTDTHRVATLLGLVHARLF